MEVIRRSFDIDGSRVELIFDEGRQRFTVASRWANLAHIPIQGLRSHAKRVAHERASAVFEVVCINGASRNVAKAARRVAIGLRPGQFSLPAYMEREIIRRFSLTTQQDQTP